MFSEHRMGNQTSCSECGHIHRFKCTTYIQGNTCWNIAKHEHHDSPATVETHKIIIKQIPYDKVIETPIYGYKIEDVIVKKRGQVAYEVEEDVDVFEDDRYEDKVIAEYKDRDVIITHTEIRYKPIKVPYTAYESRQEWYTDYSTGRYTYRSVSVPVTKYRDDTEKEYVAVPTKRVERDEFSRVEKVRIPGRKIGTKKKMVTKYREESYDVTETKINRVQTGVKKETVTRFRNKQFAEPVYNSCDKCQCLKCRPKRCNCTAMFPIYMSGI
jgi:hypothetical protein